MQEIDSMLTTTCSLSQKTVDKGISLGMSKSATIIPGTFLKYIP